MENFNAMGLPESLCHTLASMEITKPTPIQAQAIPLALEGKDILGSAQTGTGKTAAFGIPLITKLLSSPRGSALVMTPTRELAVQVMQQLQRMLGRRSPIKTALLIGGEPMPRQLSQLRARPRLLVGTPGRIYDHLQRGNLMLHDTGFMVLDETDRMLDMGFSIQIENIMTYMPRQRQTLLFSATLPTGIMKIAEKYLSEPERIAIGDHSTPAKNIKQEIIHLTEAEKYAQLTTQLDTRQGSIIVFVKTKYGAERMAAQLTKEQHNADAIHGDLRQNRRDRVIARFRKGQVRILVATDIAARGLDVPQVRHVINYDLPQCPEDYIHRIGRTARAGAEGDALCFIAPSDKLKWQAIQRLIDPEAAAAADSERKKHSKPRKSFSNKGRRRYSPSGSQKKHSHTKRTHSPATA